MESIKFTERGLGAEFDAEEIMFETRILLELLFEQDTFAEQVRAGHYGCILGIDSSGRVPALVIGNVAQHYSEVDIRFITGGRNLDQLQSEQREAALSSVVYGIKQELAPGKKVLLVDDVIGTGGSIKDICDELRSYNIEYEVVCLAAPEFHNTDNSRAEHIGELERQIGGRIHTLNENHVPKIYGKKQMSGVDKIKGDIYSQRNPHQDQAVLARVREEVKVIANKVINKLENE